jgi:NADH pyrophosphatase NudC (nudix superfamily)
MLGCVAEALSTDIAVDKDELEVRLENQPDADTALATLSY